MSGNEITVLGAGAIGVSVALYLQQDGHDVRLIDRDEPGGGCSFGNAGLIQCASVVPVAVPGLARKVPRMLIDKNQPLVIQWRYLASLAPYLLRFLAEAKPDRAAANARALASIVPTSYDAYGPLIAAAGIQSMVKPSGELHVFESDSAFMEAQANFDMRRAHGVEVELLDADGVRQLEPALVRSIKRGVFLPGCYQIADPFRFVDALARHFVADGGTFLKAAVEDLTIASDGSVEIVTDGGRLSTEKVVLAFGAFSKPFAKRLGLHVQLDSERGYHINLPNPGVALNRTVVSGDHRFALAPIDGDIRVVGTAELAKVGAPPNYPRAERLMPLARRLLPGLAESGRTKWMGHRPSTPDSLPVIGRSERYQNVFFAFGHNHSGLTLGGMTGKLIADIVAGRHPPVDLSPFNPARFQR
jgi:D-amino-acid dehydrogenase